MLLEQKKLFFRISLFLITFFVFILLITCHKNFQQYFTNNKTSDLKLAKPKISLRNNAIPLQESVIQKYLGTNVIIFSNRVENIDEDKEKEHIVFFKKNNKELISFAIFKITDGNVFKTFEADTNSDNYENIDYYFRDLFADDQLELIIEGTHSDKGFTLDIFKLVAHNYVKISELDAKYSISLEYMEIEKLDEAKKNLLKEIILITKPEKRKKQGLRQKMVYVWENESEHFILQESSYFMEDISNVNKYDFVQTINLFKNFVTGDWYPEEIARNIENHRENPQTNNFNIKMIFFDMNDESLVISYNDYAEKFKILRIVKQWRKFPLFRFKIMKAGLTDDTVLQQGQIKLCDIEVVNDKLLNIYLPYTYERKEKLTILRLKKSFFDYSTDNENKNNRKILNYITSYLKREFKSIEGLSLTFKKPVFHWVSRQENYTGEYHLVNNKKILLIFHNEQMEKFFILNLTVIDKSKLENVVRLHLIPCKITAKGYKEINEQDLILEKITTKK